MNFGTEAEAIFQGCIQDPLLGWKQSPADALSAN